MRIITARRISQAFFIMLFLWFCVVTVAGDKIFQVRGWCVNLFLWLDPLVAVGTILATWTLYLPLLFGLLTIVMTLLFGRIFCGWVCPFGTTHQFIGYLFWRKKKVSERIKINKYNKCQSLKYLILIFFVVTAAIPWARSLMTGLLDPIPLFTKSVNLILLPLIDNQVNVISATDRLAEGGIILAIFFIVMLLMNLFAPRFFCRFVCPTGALLGCVSSFSLFRIVKNDVDTINCGLCEKGCEGGCEPAGKIRNAECVMCLNCKTDCIHGLIGYKATKSAEAGIEKPDIGRRGFALSLLTGIFAIPAVRLSGSQSENWDNSIIRPPGSLPEEQFLQRCIKCGQCMKICPTNVLQPAGFDKGVEALWTPILNNRIGSSGCQLNCVSCGFVCPTAAIRPITIEEKLGIGEFADKGPIKMGTAFFDKGRCLPWAMDKPCIVCQENCPVSPKAIFTRTHYQTIRNGIKTITDIMGNRIEFEENIEPDSLASGDFYVSFGDKLVKIISNHKNSLIFEKTDEISGLSVDNIKEIEIKVKLQRPYVDIEKCIGCGICEHECPVSGKRAVSVSADGQSREPEHKILLET